MNYYDADRKPVDTENMSYRTTANTIKLNLEVNEISISLPG